MSLLVAENLSAGYDGQPIVRHLDLTVDQGEVVALLGANGAGKTTSMLSLAGELEPLGGTITFDGDSKQRPLHLRARRGLAFVTEERSVLMTMTVAENLRLGRCDVEYALHLFPELAQLTSRLAGLLSGGEQQILTLARALARRPKLLLADELSLGLAPLVVERLLRAVRSAASEEGMAVLLVEQHVSEVLQIADRAYVMRRGEVVLSGSAADVRDRVSDVEASYIASS